MVNNYEMSRLLECCRLCPRECGVNRFERKGFCGEDAAVRIARAGLHMWEEPCISGSGGAGTVFFSGCTLKCVYCQNFEISHRGKGFELSCKELAETFMMLKEQGAHNIDLVNPTHFVPQIIEALDMLGDRLGIPVVYNSGGYDKPETIELLGGRAGIFLPDLKYYDSGASKKYSAAEDYFDRAIDAIEAMHKAAGDPVIKDGIMQSGVIVRHLILPNHRHDSMELFRRLRERFEPHQLLVSIMSQYVPMYKAKDFHELDRRLSGFEYKSVCDEIIRLGFDGYFQERTSADEGFVPEFFDKKYF